MKKIKKISIIFIIIVSLILPVYSKVLAKDITDGVYFGYTEEYKKYLELSEEEKENQIPPRGYDIIDTGVVTKSPLYFARLYGSANETKYSLRDTIPNNTTIKNQQNTAICWAFAALTSLETNLALTKDASKTYDFSERHMDYATTRTFANGAINPVGFNRKAGTEGNFDVALSYLTNGSGAVDEASMPFENNGNTINISAIQNKPVTSEVYDTVAFPSYSITDDTTTIKNQIKEHIKSYGAVVASIYIEQNSANMEYINRTTGAIYCDNSSKEINHQLAIIGWNNDYAVTNFNSAHRPSAPGAWIVKNSWGTDVGENGIMYLSYEDINVYKYTYGIIKSANSVDYENIYQYNTFGANGELTFPSSKAYFVNIFDKKTSSKEYITQVSLQLSETATCKVYVNPNGSSMSQNDLQAVELQSGSSETVGAGYHTLEFLTPIEIKSNNFVVAVEMQGKRENEIKAPVEANFTDEEHKIYEPVTIESSKCFATYGNTYNASQLIDLSKLSQSVSGAQNVDSTIKVFTTSQVEDNSLNRIEITTPPTKTAYFEGENFDKTAMVVTAYYNNNTSKVIDNYTIPNRINLKEGQTSVTISFEGKSTTQAITVQKNTVESISITAPPVYTNYLAGHDFDKTGMIVQATFKDGTTQTITDYTITNGSRLTTNQTYVTISYANKTVNQPITVNENPIESIKIKTPPSKVKYFVGEDFDKTGMVVVAEYTDGYQVEITDFTIENGTKLKESQEDVTVKYENKTVTQGITVVEKPTNSDFSNIQSVVKNIDVYTFTDTSKESYATVDIELSGIKFATTNENMKYYYYLSPNSNESNITNWVEIENASISDDKISFKISTKDISNLKELENATDTYLYIKEVAISNNSDSTIISKAMKLESDTGTGVKISVDNQKIVDEKISASVINSNGSTGGTTSSGASSSSTKNDQTVSSSKLPKTGVKTVLFGIIIAFILGTIGYIRYKKLNKYVK